MVSAFISIGMHPATNKHSDMGMFGLLLALPSHEKRTACASQMDRCAGHDYNDVACAFKGYSKRTTGTAKGSGSMRV